MPASPIAFGPFRLDLEKRRLLRGDAPIELRRKAWEVLRHLCERPGHGRDHGRAARRGLAGIAVTPQTVTNVIRELRLALADRAGGPRWIQTRARARTRLPVHNRPIPARPPPRRSLVGREREQQPARGVLEPRLSRRRHASSSS